MATVADIIQLMQAERDWRCRNPFRTAVPEADQAGHFPSGWCERHLNFNVRILLCFGSRSHGFRARPGSGRSR